MSEDIMTKKIIHSPFFFCFISNAEHSSCLKCNEADSKMKLSCLSDLLAVLSGSNSTLHGLCFLLCRLSLKPNTGTRSHLPGMAQMPRTIPMPYSHKTEVRQEAVINGGAFAPCLLCLHNLRTCWRTSDV